MITMRPLLALLVTVLIACALAGCHSSVRFQPHAPYGAPRRFAEPLIVVHPDDMEELRYTTDVGGFMRPRKFHIHYGEALKYETHARFHNMFNGVFIISKSDYDALKDRVEEEDLDMYSLPESLSEARGYLLDISRIRFEINSDRPIYLVELAFSNRATGTELFRGTMRGGGTNITIRESTDFMIRELTDAVISSNTSLLNPLAERVRRAIAEEPPPQTATDETGQEPDPETTPAPNADTTPDPGTEEPQEVPPEEPPHPRLRPFFVTPE